MPIAAALQYTQDSVVGGAGQAYVGVPSEAVTVANAVDTGVTEWTYAFVSVPTGSSFTPGIVQSGTTPTYTFTPDVPGSYLFQLTVTDGTTSVSDSRSFLAADSRGYLYFSYFDSAETLNYGSPPNTQGWEPGLNAALKDIHDNAFIPEYAVTYCPGGPTSAYTFSDWNLLMAYVATLPQPPQVSSPPVTVYIDGTYQGSGIVFIPAGSYTLEMGISFVAASTFGNVTPKLHFEGNTQLYSAGKISFTNLDVIVDNFSVPLNNACDRVTLINSTLTVTQGVSAFLTNGFFTMDLFGASSLVSGVALTAEYNATVNVYDQSYVGAQTLAATNGATITINALSFSNVSTGYIGATGFTVNFQIPPTQAGRTTLTNGISPTIPVTYLDTNSRISMSYANPNASTAFGTLLAPDASRSAGNPGSFVVTSYTSPGVVNTNDQSDVDWVVVQAGT